MERVGDVAVGDRDVASVDDGVGDFNGISLVAGTITR